MCARRYKHWIRSVNARLRTRTVFEPFDSIAREKPILAAVPFVQSFFHIFFPFSLFFLSIEIYRVRFFFFSCNYFSPPPPRFNALVTLPRSIDRSIDRSLISFVPLSKDRGEEIHGQVSFSLFPFPLVYIFRFQRDIVDVVLVLFLARTIGGGIKRGDVYAGKFYWPFFFPPRRARLGNGMRQRQRDVASRSGVWIPRASSLTRSEFRGRVALDFSLPASPPPKFIRSS